MSGARGGGGWDRAMCPRANNAAWSTNSSAEWTCYHRIAPSRGSSRGALLSLVFGQTAPSKASTNRHNRMYRFGLLASFGSPNSPRQCVRRTRSRLFPLPQPQGPVDKASSSCRTAGVYQQQRQRQRVHVQLDLLVGNRIHSLIDRSVGYGSRTIHRPKQGGGGVGSFRTV